MVEEERQAALNEILRKNEEERLNYEEEDRLEKEKIKQERMR
jgi:hypothetical protein